MSPRLPNFFVIGAPKCGTTTLYDLLRDHPDIYMSPVKEPGFYSSERQFARGLNYYVDTFFRNSESYPVRGEATPWYLYHPSVPERIAASVGEDARFIAILRDPVDRAYSMYLNHVRRGLEHGTFEQGLDAEPARRAANIHTGNPYAYGYVECSHYASSLKRYIARFGRSQLLVVVQDDLIADPGAVVKSIHRFLGVTVRDTADLARRSNPAGVPKSVLVRRLLLAGDKSPPGVRRVLGRLVPARMYRPAFEALARHNTKVVALPTIDVKTARRLRESFSEEISELEAILNRDLSAWRLGGGREA